MGRIRDTAYRLKRALGMSKQLHCSACNGLKDDSGRIRFVSGPGVYMCETCIHSAAVRLAGEGTVHVRTRCSFCGLQRNTLPLAPLEVCAGCIRLMEAILAEDDTIRNRPA